MTIETIEKNYPKIFKRLLEDSIEVRHLLVIDENYHDDDTDEFDGMNAEDFNYLIYVTEMLQEAVGEKAIVEMVKGLKDHKSIEDFYLSEVDLYGIKTVLNKEGIAAMVLSTLEGKLT